MSAAELKYYASQLLAARASRADAFDQVRAAESLVVAAEKALITAILEAPGEDREDGATAFVHDGCVFRLPEEYWERRAGEQVAIERLIGGAS